MVSEYSVVLLKTVKEIVEAIYSKRTDCIDTAVKEYKNRIIDEQQKR